LCGLDVPTSPALLRGLADNEDAGVYRLDEKTALVQSVDVLTPMTDDPRAFGRVAAANALSDLYAMGARPITALSIVCFPVASLGVDALRSALQGAADTLREADAVLLGGHSIKDEEPKLGLAVTGLVNPEIMMTNDALSEGDSIILTKPIGTGAVATGLRRGKGLLGPLHESAMLESMGRLNRKACELALEAGLRACTDITGFGLVGHLLEMARASAVSLTVDTAAIALLPGALEAAKAGLLPGGEKTNREFYSKALVMDRPIAEPLDRLVFDPQTSGGLALGIATDRAQALLDALEAAGLEAALIGEVREASAEPKVHLR